METIDSTSCENGRPDICFFCLRVCDNLEKKQKRSFDYRIRLALDLINYSSSRWNNARLRIVETLSKVPVIQWPGLLKIGSSGAIRTNFSFFLWYKITVIKWWPKVALWYAWKEIAALHKTLTTSVCVWETVSKPSKLTITRKTLWRNLLSIWKTEKMVVLYSIGEFWSL